MVEVEVVGVRTHVGDDETVVLLLDPDSGLLVPILIGPAEASAIAAAQRPPSKTQKPSKNMLAVGQPALVKSTSVRASQAQQTNTVAV